MKDNIAFKQYKIMFNEKLELYTLIDGNNHLDFMPINQLHDLPIKFLIGKLTDDIMALHFNTSQGGFTFDIVSAHESSIVLTVEEYINMRLILDDH